MAGIISGSGATPLCVPQSRQILEGEPGKKPATGLCHDPHRQGGQDPARDGCADVLVRADAGTLGTDHQGVLLHRFLQPHGAGAQANISLMMLLPAPGLRLVLCGLSLKYRAVSGKPLEEKVPGRPWPWWEGLLRCSSTIQLWITDGPNTPTRQRPPTRARFWPYCNSCDRPVPSARTPCFAQKFRSHQPFG